MTRSSRTWILALGICLAMTVPSWAQLDQPEVIPEPDPEDVESVDAIITALYDVISGPASEERDWERFLSLFAPGARLVPTGRDESGAVRVRIMTPVSYAELASQWFTREGGFFEKEIGRKVHSWGNIAQVFSAYASFKENEEEPFMRGINSIQLVRTEERWAIVTVFWDSERDQNKIPDEFLNME